MKNWEEIWKGPELKVITSGAMFILSEIQRTAKCIAPSKCIIRNISHFRFFQFSRKYFVFEASGKVDWPKIMSSNHYTADNFDRMWREDQEKKLFYTLIFNGVF